ncbi:uncharacterized protein [Arachis hypogaea]|uniref:uncharacterized protein n=1 Tax=Arachis hypogaea TaxID=3818 RepID=UPI003B216FD8
MAAEPQNSHSSISQAPMPPSFTSSPISMKLDEDNFLQWKDQAESTIEGHDLLHHITGERIPTRFLPSGETNPRYAVWKRQDSLLKSWLLALMTKPFTTRMVGCVYAYEVWKRLDDHFSSQIRAKIMQLKHKLSSIKIGNSVNEYVFALKSTIDALASVGEPMRESDHVNAILNSLTEEYANVITSVVARPVSISVGELEALLLTHESILERFRKPESFIQANLAQHTQGYNIRGGSRGGDYRNRGGRSIRSGRFGTGQFQNRNVESGQGNNSRFEERFQNDNSRFMNNSARSSERPICQVCDKIGHTAKTCWYRYERDDNPRSQYAAQNSSNNSTPQALLATPSTAYDPNWYPDSGATHHMTSDEQDLTEGVMYEGSDQVIVGNGSGSRLNSQREAFTSAANLINQLPTPTLENKPPVEKLFGKKPDYTSFRVFGCLCFPHLRPYNKNKLEFRSSPCVFTGYSPLYKGYRCLTPGGKTIITRNVVFDERKFPFKDGKFLHEDSNPPLLALQQFPTIPIVYAHKPSPVPSLTQRQPNTFSSSPLTSATTSTASHEPSGAQFPTSPAINDNSQSIPSTQQPFLSTQSAAPSNIPIPIPISDIEILLLAEPAPPTTTSSTNTHSMITRSKSNCLRPRAFHVSVEPRSVKDAMAHPQWKEAIDLEYNALMKNQTWKLVPLPKGREAIGSKWVYRVKYNADGTLHKYKARLVAQEFSQRPGFDFTETYSLVVKPTSIRIVLTAALHMAGTLGNWMLIMPSSMEI